MPVTVSDAERMVDWKTRKVAPGPSDLAAAARRLRGVAVRTPLAPAASLSREMGRPVFVNLTATRRTFLDFLRSVAMIPSVCTHIKSYC